MRQAIRIVIIVGNLFLGSMAISANWYQIYEDDEQTVSIETKHMKIQEDQISYWEKWVYKNPKKYWVLEKPKKYIEGLDVSTQETYYTYDCKKRMTGFTTAVLYDKEGNTLFSHKYPLRMRQVTPKSLEEYILEATCTIKKNIEELKQ
ncbi:MAG TPA: surface-adhesin E family protein [Thermodesulfobacteriota bacterium]|nr:surface-adhesin E family protein [Thermodesulfobacteriota bacterium]